MQFIDLALIHIRSGSGGSGCSSFRREKFIEFGGPMVATEEKAAMLLSERFPISIR